MDASWPRRSATTLGWGAERRIAELEREIRELRLRVERAEIIGEIPKNLPPLRLPRSSFARLTRLRIVTFGGSNSVASSLGGSPATPEYLNVWTF